MLYCAWRYGGEDPYLLYNDGAATPPSSQPWRQQYFMYALAAYAHDTEMRLHSVHPEQRQDGSSGNEGTEIRMPGGRRGFKK